ncbi:MAG TPA: thiamine phosphate synthase [Solirubrobacteraceae bacterium]|jgi:thiamine-phosphate pyrophosphorylase
MSASEQALRREHRLGAQRRWRLAAAQLYLVCDAQPGGRELEEVLPAAIAGGVEIVQLREKQLDDERLLAAARRAVAICRPRNALLVVNDRPDIALQADADGVHVGQDDMPVAAVRELVGEGLLVGLSTHAPSEIDAVTASWRPDAGFADAVGEPGSPDWEEAEEELDQTSERPPGVDYIGVGPVHATPTKPGRPAVGVELVAYAAEHADLPFFAIGGLDAGNLDEVLAAGASRVCVLRAIAEAPDPKAAALALRELIDIAAVRR